jgi:hypothetical protein
VDPSEHPPKEPQQERLTRATLELAGLSPAEVDRLSSTELELLSHITDPRERVAQTADILAHKHDLIDQLLTSMKDIRAGIEKSDRSEYHPNEPQQERLTRATLELAGLSPAEVDRLSSTELELLSHITDPRERGAQAADILAHKHDLIDQLLTNVQGRADMETSRQPAVSDGQGDKLVRLQELGVLQGETNTALLPLAQLEAGGARAPDEAFERYLGLARRLVVGVADFERD